MRALLAAIATSVMAVPASAEETWTVTGAVVESDGSPVSGATVVLTQGTRLESTSSDAGGRFRFERVGDGPYQLLAILGATKTTVSSQGEGPVKLVLDVRTETIRIDELPPVKVAAQVDQTTVPRRWPYSDAAIDRNAWATVWLVVLVDRTGKVVDGRVLKSPPGFHLDEIALASARKLRYRPARDDAGEPIMSQAVVVLEWPPYWGGPPAPCKGSGPYPLATPDLMARTGMEDPGTSYRDCEPPKGLERFRLRDLRKPLKTHTARRVFERPDEIGEP